MTLSNRVVFRLLVIVPFAGLFVIHHYYGPKGSFTSLSIEIRMSLIPLLLNSEMS